MYDGDTFTATVVHGEGDAVFREGAATRWTFRLDGIDTPEMHPPLSTPHREQVVARAKAARSRLVELIDPATCRIECGGFDKYGRVLCRVLLADGRAANDILIAESLAKEYHGGHKD